MTMGLGRIGGFLACVGLVVAHGGVAHQKPLSVDPDADWGTRHMAGEVPHLATSARCGESLRQSANAKAEEHQIENFDARAFFTLHDFDNNGVWDQAEILKFYGMEDETAKDVSQEKKDNLVREILRLMDNNHNGQVEKEEWDRYHDEFSTEEDLIHPEDIEHFKKHDDLEDEADRVAALDKMSIVEQNIPDKFRKDKQ